MPKSKKPTIRKRLIFLFVAVIGIFVVLATSYVLANFRLRSEIEDLQTYYELFYDSLEVRRYEKNLLYHIGKENYQHLMQYIDILSEKLYTLDREGKLLSNPELSYEIRQTLEQYKTLIDQGHKSGHYDAEKIRETGRELSDLAYEILQVKSIQLQKKLHHTMLAFLVSTAIFLWSILCIFAYHYKLIFSRIDKIYQATSAVAKGTFTPIQEDFSNEDEISALIRAFNKMVDEIEAKQAQLLQAEKLAALGTFSSGIAHEINNPLNNILLTADTLEEEWNYLSEEEAKEMVHDIIQQTERASKIVRNLLDFSRQTEPEQVELDIKKVILDTERLVHNQLSVQGIKFEANIPDGLPHIVGDPNKLKQVFLNLFINGAHAIGEKEDGRIIVTAQRTPDGYIRIDFSDNGCGISQEHIQHIFEPFFTTKRVGEGTGLGLSIVYGIIKKHGGFIEVHSTVGKGTTFSIFLPIKDEAPHREHSGEDKSLGKDKGSSN